MAKRWYTSDLHFGHKRIIELCKRPFRDVTEMDYMLVHKWNGLVSDEDTVYILGDLAMGDIKESLNLVKKLKGKKVLIPGNHDRVHPCYPQKPEKGELMRRMYEDAGLVIAPLEVEAFPSGSALDKIVLPWKLCHFPVSGDHTAEERYPEYRPTVCEGQWLIHGHVHDLWRVRGKQINVGVDVWDFAPIPESTIDLMISMIDHFDGLSEKEKANKIHPSNHFEMMSFS